MQSFKELYEDPRFDKVSSRTKTDIISTIGFDIESGQEAVAESKLTEQELIDGLRFLLATEAPNNEHARRLVTHESSQMFISHGAARNPFYYSSNDPLFWYFVGYQNSSLHSHHYHHSRNDDDSCDRAGEGAAAAGVAIAMCLAVICCVMCMRETYNSKESNCVKGTKITASSLVGTGVFIGLMIYLFGNEVWRESLVEDKGWATASWGFLLFGVAACSGLLASGAVSTVNNLWRCLPAPPAAPENLTDAPAPTPEIESAIKELATIKELLQHGWTHEGDDKEQSDAFVREVILLYIKKMSYREDLRIAISVNPVPSSPRFFSRSPEASNDNQNEKETYKARLA